MDTLFSLETAICIFIIISIWFFTTIPGASKITKDIVLAAAGGPDSSQAPGVLGAVQTSIRDSPCPRQLALSGDRQTSKVQ